MEFHINTRETPVECVIKKHAASPLISGCLLHSSVAKLHPKARKAILMLGIHRHYKTQRAVLIVVCRCL